MYANYTSMHTDSCSATAISAAAASVCANVRLDSAVMVESVFVAIIPIIVAVILIFPLF